MVNLAQHFHLLFFECLHRSALFAHLTQTQTHFAKHILQLCIELRGGVGRLRFGHSLARHHAIFLHQVGHTGKCAAVAHGVGEKPVYQTVVDRLLASVDHTLQEKVALFKLVVEKEVHLRHFQAWQPKLRHRLRAQHIHAGE